VGVDTDTAQVIQINQQYYTEVRAAALAQGNPYHPQPLSRINLIVNAPAALLPEPQQKERRSALPHTDTYLLLPRAGAIIKNSNALLSLH
jgi:hypothetical protein